MNKFCTKCGRELENNNKFCGKCGNPSNAINQSNNNIFSIIGFALTILAIIIFTIFVFISETTTDTGIIFWIISTIISICALVFSIIGFLKTKSFNDYKKILSAVSLIINICLISFTLFMIFITTIFILLY